MSDIPSTFVAIDGVDPDELSDVDQYELGEAIREYCEDTFEPDRLDVVISDEPFER